MRKKQKSDDYDDMTIYDPDLTVIIEHRINTA